MFISKKYGTGKKFLRASGQKLIEGEGSAHWYDKDRR